MASGTGATDTYFPPLNASKGSSCPQRASRKYFRTVTLLQSAAITCGVRARGLGRGKGKQSQCKGEATGRGEHGAGGPCGTWRALRCLESPLPYRWGWKGFAQRPQGGTSDDAVGPYRSVLAQTSAPPSLRAGGRDAGVGQAGRGTNTSSIPTPSCRPAPQAVRRALVREAGMDLARRKLNSSGNYPFMRLSNGVSRAREHGASVAFACASTMTLLIPHRRGAPHLQTAPPVLPAACSQPRGSKWSLEVSPTLQNSHSRLRTYCRSSHPRQSRLQTPSPTSPPTLRWSRPHPWDAQQGTANPRSHHAGWGRGQGWVQAGAGSVPQRSTMLP